MGQEANNPQNEDLTMEEILSSIKNIVMSETAKGSRPKSSQEQPIPYYPNDVEPENDLSPSGARKVEHFPKFHEFTAPKAQEFLAKKGKVSPDIPLEELLKYQENVKDVSAVDDVLARSRQAKAAKPKMSDADINQVIQRSSQKISENYKSQVSSPDGEQKQQGVLSIPPAQGHYNDVAAAGQPQNSRGHKEIDFQALNFVKNNLRDKINSASSTDSIKKFVAEEFASSITRMHKAKRAAESKADKPAQYVKQAAGYDLKKVATRDVEIKSYDEHHLLDRMFRQLLDHLVKDVIEKVVNEWMRENLPEMVAKQTHIEFDKLLGKLKSD